MCLIQAWQQQSLQKINGVQTFFCGEADENVMRQSRGIMSRFLMFYSYGSRFLTKGRQFFYELSTVLYDLYNLHFIGTSGDFE